MDKKIEFKYLWSLMKKNKEFNDLCDDRGIEEEEQKYIVVMTMGQEITDKERCEIIKLKYNFRPHRQYKSNHEADAYNAMMFLTAQELTTLQKTPNQDPNRAKLTVIEKLDVIINGDFRVADQLNAIQLREKLVEKRQGSHILQAWERIWCDVIIPNMVSTNTLG